MPFFLTVFVLMTIHKSVQALILELIESDAAASAEAAIDYVTQNLLEQDIIQIYAY